MWAERVGSGSVGLFSDIQILPVFDGIATFDRRNSIETRVKGERIFSSIHKLRRCFVHVACSRRSLDRPVRLRGILGRPVAGEPVGIRRESYSRDPVSADKAGIISKGVWSSRALGNSIKLPELGNIRKEQSSQECHEYHSKPIASQCAPLSIVREITVALFVGVLSELATVLAFVAFVGQDLSWQPGLCGLSPGQVLAYADRTLSMRPVALDGGEQSCKRIEAERVPGQQAPGVKPSRPIAGSKLPF